MKKALSNELGKLCALCHKISTTTEHDVFFDYSPHVNGVCVRVYVGGYEEEKGLDYLTMVGGDKVTFKNINRIKAKLQKYKKAPTEAGTSCVGTDLND